MNATISPGRTSAETSTSTGCPSRYLNPICSRRSVRGRIGSRCASGISRIGSGVEQGNLLEEHVNVERRPVDRATTGTEDAFRERTIEAEEKREVPVVSKEARVTEE